MPGGSLGIHCGKRCALQLNFIFQEPFLRTYLDAVSLFFLIFQGIFSFLSPLLKTKKTPQFFLSYKLKLELTGLFYMFVIFCRALSPMISLTRLRDDSSQRALYSDLKYATCPTSLLYHSGQVIYSRSLARGKHCLYLQRYKSEAV